MNIQVSLLVLVIVTGVSSRGQVSLTCAETAQGRLKPVMNCTLHETVILCVESANNSKLTNATAFKILDNIPQTDNQFCLGLINSTRKTDLYELDRFCNQTVGFNSSQAVGVVTMNRDCWKTKRSPLCLADVSILEEVLELSVMKYFPDSKEFWNFESMLYGTTMGWFQLLYVHLENTETCLVSSDWITNLQNTNIRDLSVKCAFCGDKEDGYLIKNMPYLQKLKLNGACAQKLHNDSFTGTPILEDVTLGGNSLRSFPTLMTRLPKLKKLDLSNNRIYDFNEDKTLPQLHHLEFLNMAHNSFKALDKFPKLNELKYLILKDCTIKDLKRDAFRNISLLETLDLSFNTFISIHKEAFISLRNLKLLNLNGNLLGSWPVLYFCSLLNLNLKINQLTSFTNPCVSGTIEQLDVSTNSISVWDDIGIFSRNNTDLFRNDIVEDNLTTVMLIGGKDQQSVYNEYKTVFENNWVKILDISSNGIHKFTDTMLKSMDKLEKVILSNPIDCGDCTIPQFQNWIKTTKTEILKLPQLVCDEPYRDKFKPVIDLEFDIFETCLVKGHNYWIIAGIPLGIVFIVLLIIFSIYFRFRSQIVYVQHLYRIRKQKTESRNNCNFDAFVCYSGEDRHFVLQVLTPFLESCSERYKLCLHERDFPLGSHIVDNIVGGIEHSRKVILILSPHFINSKWCNWELEMANHEMFDDDKQFLILIQVAPIDRDTIPRHLKFYMDTRTFLTWTGDASESAMKDMRRQLEQSMGTSIFRTSNEQSTLVAGAMDI